jgi:thioesterase domain-containing protein
MASDRVGTRSHFIGDNPLEATPADRAPDAHRRVAGYAAFQSDIPGDESMLPAELERYLHLHIPLSRAMQVSVVAVGAATVVLKAPLEPNINHQETVFGGSASALAILAAWSLLHTCLLDAGIASRLVIQRNRVAYELPIDGEFTARSSIEDTEAWHQFVRMLTR